MQKNPIPNEYSSWNTFMALRDLNLDRLKTILDKLLSGAGELSSSASKLADFYSGMMDEERIEAAGVGPLIPVLNLCRTARHDPASAIGQLHSRYGVKALFSLYSSPDKKNSEHTIAALYQSGLGLPDRDYYFDADKLEKRQKYKEYIELVFRLLGEFGVAEFSAPSVCREAAGSVFNLEATLASRHLTRTQCRDPELTYNKMTPGEVETLFRGDPGTWNSYIAYGIAGTPSALKWSAYLEAVGLTTSSCGDVNVATVDAIKQAVSIAGSAKYRYPLLETAQSSALEYYLIFHSVLSYSAHLPRAFVSAHFNFFEKELSGTSELRPRWKRSLEALESALGEELGKLYVASYFPSDSKARALAVVEAVRGALDRRLREVDWMSEATRAEALRKMEKFRVKIGFPDRWIDYSALPIEPYSNPESLHLNNVAAARRFAFALELSRINAPTDRERWFMTPQTVNAYYHPSLNEIVFPAAILQHPFFDAGNDLAVNFGSLGAVVGHEMTHGFDDQGRKYDSSGNMRDWWAGTDGEEYERRAEVMIQQAEQFEVHGLKLKGKLTCGENIADLGGVKLALAALKSHMQADPAAVPAEIDGFNPVQRFFLSWSQAWRQNVKKERALQLVTIDPHGPNEFRCNGTLSNIAEFLDAFDVREGDAMYKPEASRVNIW
jgi:putative endopeptidase